jgi:flagellar biosynthetic protein FliP
MSRSAKTLRTVLAVAVVAAAWLLATPTGAAAQPAPPAITGEQLQETLAQVVVDQAGAASETNQAGAGATRAQQPTGQAGQQRNKGVTDVGVSVDSQDPNLSRTVIIILMLTVGSVAPGLLLMMTAFTRFVVVLGLVKNALGLQTVPPAQVLIGLALFLTFFVMNPVLSEVNEKAIQPMLAGTIGQGEAIEAGFKPVRQFMLAQTRDEDLRLFMDLSNTEQPTNPDDVSAAVLIPAFAISELRAAFIIGFIIYIPFLVIDLVVSAVLMSMGMMMLPPVFVSMPLKLLLFVLVDGWVLIVGSLVNSVDGIVV